MAKALGFTTAISKLSEYERQENPSEPFGQDYNRFRSLVMEKFPELESYLPPEAEIAELGYCGRCTVQKYGEICTFAEQILQLLDVGKDGHRKAAPG